MIRGQEWLIVLLIVVIIFGARKLPELARSLGASAKEFRRGVDEGSEKTAEAQATDHPAERPASDTHSPDEPDRGT